MSNENPTLENIITEPDLIVLLAVKKEALGNLRRNKRLPFLKISTRSRVYLDSDITEWLIGRRVVLNRDEVEAE